MNPRERSPMDLSVIIVNWNAAEFVRNCLPSIAANGAGINLEVLVVDNASYDGVEEIVQKEFPWTKLIQSPANLGFASANNLGFSHSRGRNILFLNPDTEVVGPALQRLLGTLDSIPNAGIVGARLLNSDGSLQTSCVQAFPTLLNQVLDAEILRRLFPRSRLWGMRALFESNDCPTPVDAVSGACLMIRREVFEKVGRFTTEYFMYGEDLDLCWNVRRGGWTACHVPDAIVIHYGGQSTKRQQDGFANIVMRTSVCEFLRRNRGASVARLYRWSTFGSAIVRIVILGVRLVVSRGAAARAALRGSLSKWTKILRWSLGLEQWTGSLKPGVQEPGS